MATKQTEGKITVLYERLSRDDEQAGNSNSIVNQKKYLEIYAEQKGYTNCQHYTDLQILTIEIFMKRINLQKEISLILLSELAGFHIVFIRLSRSLFCSSVSGLHLNNWMRCSSVS